MTKGKGIRSINMVSTSIRKIACEASAFEFTRINHRNKKHKTSVSSKENSYNEKRN